ncbi:GPR87 protein, partial [Sylvia borin]|nr:GPR87 protein [Sylvia borin]
MGYNLSYGKLPENHLSPDNSSSANASSPGHTTRDEFTTIVLPVLYLLIFLASLLLNGLAVWIFFHIRNKTSFIFYLKNIVVADLLMTLTFPFKIIQDSQLGPWHFNSFLCRYSAVLFYANMYTTIVFLGLISIDRYLKVVKPFGDSRMYSITFTKALSAGVWVVMAFLALPNLILTNAYPTRRNVDDCLKLKSPLGVKWHSAVVYINTCMFVVVLVVLIGCYIAISRYIYKSSKQFISSSSRKRKHNQSIRVVVAVFFTCFLPYHLCRIPFTFSHLDKILDDSAHKILYYCKEMTLFLSACNVCLDPIIYFFMCRSFSRRLFRKSNMRTRSESIRSLQSVRRSEVRIYHEYTDV